MKKIRVLFQVGEDVSIRILNGKAVVISIKISEGGTVEYLCRWFHDGNARCEWLTSSEIEKQDGNRRIGFSVEGL